MAINKAVFGNGCFWCTEAIYERLKGIESITSGYAGGTVENPTYEAVSGGQTGHAEAIRIEYNPEIIKYKDLLNVFFAIHDPTTLNRQGNDVGTQYRSVIFYVNTEQRDEAQAFIKQLEDDGTYDDPIVTEVLPLNKFWPAESYHQRYYDENQSKPYCQLLISPKIVKLRQKFAPLLKPE